MRGPSDKRSTNEIVADIIKLVETHFLESVIDRTERERQRRWVEDHARRRIDDLRTKPPPFTGNQKENRKYAKKIRGQIDELVNTLKSLPSGFLPSALFGERFWPLWAAQEAEGERTAVEFNPQTRRYIEQEELVHLKLFLAELDRLRSRCAQIDGLELGEHGNTEHQKVHAANAAREILMDVASRTGTDWRPTDAPEGILCRVASLLFEAATGKYNKDLRRQCQTILSGKIKT